MNECIPIKKVNNYISVPADNITVHVVVPGNIPSTFSSNSETTVFGTYNSVRQKFRFITALWFLFP